MSKFQSYHYEQEGVTLDFNFEEKEDINSKKKSFIELLKNALSDLAKEI